LVTGSADGIVRCWQVTETNLSAQEAKADTQKLQVTLRWASDQRTLVAPGALLKGAIGLSPLNKKLLEQRGCDHQYM